jgi:hypothetical protein
MLTIPKQINIASSATAGMDCLELCLDKEHFLNYTKKIQYKYNSRGFRDAEWPNDLSDVIWCVGDSATMGIGQPHEETWPQLLEKRTGKTCLNLGELGCSNDTIALRAQEICKLHDPKLIVVMWSYIHRRRMDDVDVQFDKNDFGTKKDFINFYKNYKIVDNLLTNIIHLIIPDAFIDSKKILNYFILKFNVKNLLFFPKLDYARDYHHFDVKTSNHVCDLIIEKIHNFDKTSK